MRKFLPSSALLAVLCPCALFAADYSKEAVVIREVNQRVTFAADGQSDSHVKIAVTLQSEALVRQYGVVEAAYNSSSEQVEFEYVRVHKPDGSIVETPLSSVMDVSTPVATSAPTYSDLREKQIPVKSLGLGDTLEYAVHTHVTKPDVPGEFWYEQTFPDDAVILSDTLEIRTPKDKYVQVESPKLKPETRDEADQRIYTWKYSQLEPSKPVDPKKQLANPDDPPKVQLTTFRNWQEIGDWWSKLAAPQVAVTPSIEAKARELTAGKTNDLDKAKAIYAYVALRFRYISISLGQGRYQPHSAQEVLSNQYGDCKDKDTLLRSLLKAAGIDAWPALIGAGIKFDPSVPSLVQFNHVVTVLPQNGKYIWLDSTSEVAPFGMLAQEIRDQQALVIPSKEKPMLMKTPLDLPFAALNQINVKSSLSADGVLTAHFAFSFFGDEALGFRGALHQLAPAQWQLFAQQVSYTLGYAGDVSAVSVDNLDDIDKPIEYSYDYTRKDYSDWSELRITPPIPPLGFGPGAEADKPKEAFWAGAPGKSVYQASIQLPKNFTAEVPKDVTASSPFAQFTSRYSVKDGVIHAERVLTITKAKVDPAQWDDYRNFIKAMSDDQRNYTVLTDNSKPTIESASDSNPAAFDLIRKAMVALQSGDRTTAADELAQAEHLSPKEQGLWLSRAFLDYADQQQAGADFRKELEYNPDNFFAIRAFTAWLLQVKRPAEAIEVAEKGVALHPENAEFAGTAANLLIDQNRFEDALSLLQKPLSAAPENTDLRSLRVRALLGTKRPEAHAEALSEANTLRDRPSDPMLRNGIAYAFAQSGDGLNLAEQLAQSAIKDTETEADKPTLITIENIDLRRMWSLSAEWDTLGWIYFKQSASASALQKHELLDQARKYLNASWNLSQESEVAEHLADLDDETGRKQEAIEMWRYALVRNKLSQTAKDHLRAAGVPEQTKPLNARTPSPAENLVHARTFGIPSLPKQTATADFYILLSANGERDAQFISGTEPLRSATDSVKSAIKFTFPDNGPEKIIRRGILSCSMYTTPSCQLTLMLPNDVHK